MNPSIPGGQGFTKFMGRENGRDVGISAKAWLEMLERKFMLEGVADDVVKVAQAKSAVEHSKGNAKDIIPLLPSDDWSSFKENVRGLFASSEVVSQRTNIQNLMFAKWVKGEEWTTFAMKVVSQAKELFAAENIDFIFQVADVVLMTNMPDQISGEFEDNAPVTNEQELLQLVFKSRTAIEAAGASSRGNVAGAEQPKKEKKPANAPSKKPQAKQENQQKPKQTKNVKPKQKNDEASENCASNNAGLSEYEVIHNKCSNCNQQNVGHGFKNCPNGAFCSFCKQAGHSYFHCQKKPKKPTGTITAKTK